MAGSDGALQHVQMTLATIAGPVQEENMVSNKEIAQKYKSAEEFEDDFM